MCTSVLYIDDDATVQLTNDIQASILGLSLLSCPHCEAAFPTVPTLNDHIESKHRKGNTDNNLSPPVEKANISMVSTIMCIP